MSESLALYREALAGRRAALGDAHPHTLASLHNLALLLQSHEEFEAAEPLLREALDGRRAALGTEHPKTLATEKHLRACREGRKRAREGGSGLFVTRSDWSVDAACAGSFFMPGCQLPACSD